MTAHFDRNISFVTSLIQTPLKIFISSPKILMTKSSYFPYIFPTFHHRTPYFSPKIIFISSFTISYDLLLAVDSKYPAIFYLSTPSPFIHHCKNTLSSLHIFVHHCSFCASLHVKINLGLLNVKMRVRPMCSSV